MCTLFIFCVALCAFQEEKGGNSDASGQQVHLKLFISKNLMVSLFKTLLRIYISSLLFSW